MRVLIVGRIHRGIRNNLILSLQSIGVHVDLAANFDDLSSYDLIYSSTEPFDSSTYPNKKFIFGPQFNAIPDKKFQELNNKCGNTIYILPSPWLASIWLRKSHIPIGIYPVGINTELYKPSNIPKKKIFIYFKRRADFELDFIKNSLNKRGVTFRVIKYGSYIEHHYKALLNKSNHGIWIGCSESQGIAFQCALSMNVPLIVWDVRYMGTGNKYPATTRAYWDNKCGEYFYDSDEFDSTYTKFLKNLQNYRPRQFIIETLSYKQQAQKFLKLA